MKFVIGLLLMGQSAFASYISLDGHFKREGDLKLMLAYRVEQVYTMTEQGKARLSELRGLGHECRVITSSHYACKSFLELESVPQNIKMRIENKYQNQVVSFGVLRATPEVINKGEHYTEYLVPQTFSFKGSSKDNYRYFESDEVDKISAGTNVPADFSFVVESEDELSIVEQTGTNERFVLTMYLVKIPFQKSM
jgi:hypothetical protein